MPDMVLRAAEAQDLCGSPFQQRVPPPEDVQAWVLPKARERKEGDLGRVGEARRNRWPFYLFEGRNENIFVVNKNGMERRKARTESENA